MAPYSFVVYLSTDFVYPMLPISLYCLLFFIALRYSITFKVILHQFWVKKFLPQNSIWNTAVPLLSYACMFQVEICSQ